MANGLLVRFRYEPIHMSFKSAEAGRPIYEDREVVEIIPIGDNKTVEVHEVTDNDRQRFPDEYRRFIEGSNHQVTGTPLEQWPFMRPAQIKMLNFFNVFSVEDLSNLGDAAIQNIGPGGRELVKQALAYLEKASAGSSTTKLVQENENLREMVDELSKQVQALLAQRGEDDGKPKRKAA